MVLRKTAVLGFIKKEFIQMTRDVRMRIVLVASPLFMILLFGYAVNLDVQDVRMAVLDEDRSQESRDLISKFVSSGYFLREADLFSERDADVLLDTGKAEVVLHILNGFSAKLRGGKTAAIQILVDGTDSGRASVTVAYVNEITARYSQSYYQKKVRLSVLSRGNAGKAGMRLRQNVELKERILFNPSMISRNFYLPGILSLIIGLITIVLTAMSIVKERETGTIEQIAVSPLSPWELIAGKTVPFIIVSFVDIIIVTLIMIFWFHVPFRGNFLFLLFASLVFVFTTTSVGLYISTISRTQQQALLSVFLFLMPAIMFGGFAFPVYLMPEPMKWIAYVNPMQYFIKMIRAIFLKGAGFTVLWTDMLYLTAIGVALFYLSSKRFSRRLE